ncbi:MAG: hypothetical protein ACLFTI_06450 [Anaerolineales bacterium]
MQPQLLSYRWWRGIFYLGIIGLMICPLVVHAATLPSDDLPPVRPPTPTPTPDPDPPLLPGRPTLPPGEAEKVAYHPCAHIQVHILAPEALGLWSVVQWQDGEDAWHDVEGWQGPLVDGEIAWWLSAPLFGAGPFRWVIMRSPDGPVVGISQPFWLPDKDRGALIIEMDDEITFE